MGRITVEPIITFSDGTQLLVSTQQAGAGHFVCELYLADTRPGSNGEAGVRAVSDRLVAPSCNEAQEIACFQARRLFPDNATAIKEPPYLVWPGPHLPMAPHRRLRRWL